MIRLAKISNFTDFELLEQHAAVEYVSPGASLSEYDCIIIPGTKNTIDDLAIIFRAVQIVKYIRPESGVFPSSESAGDTRCSEKP